MRALVVGQGKPARGGIPSFIEGLLADTELREHVDVEFLNTARGPGKRPGAASLRNLREGTEDVVEVMRRAGAADVVHLNTAAAPALPLARTIALAVAARSRGARVVIHAHTGRMHRAAEHLAYRLLLRLAVRVADAFVVVSRTAESTVARVTGRRPRYLPNGVDVAGFEAPPSKDEPPTIAFVGTVCERKGILDLAAALVTLRERGLGSGSLRVIVVGDARQEGPGVFERIRRAYERLGLGWAEFTGAVPRAEVARILARSAIFCLPSHWEGFPLSVLEAMASGCAVVATSVGDVPAVLDDGRAGVVVPAGDPDALADALERLVRSPAVAADLGRRARLRVEAEYGLPHVSAAVLSIYRALDGSAATSDGAGRSARAAVTRGSRARAASPRSRAVRPR